MRAFCLTLFAALTFTSTAFATRADCGSAFTSGAHPRPIIFLGGPGSGKGTHAELLGKSLGLAHISVGDLLRHEVETQTELGRLVAPVMARGEIVSNESQIAVMIAEALAKRLRAPDCVRGFILDGYPRVVGQVERLDHLLRDVDAAEERVIFLDAPAEVLTERLMRRGRKDDTPEVIATRLAEFDQTTRPVIALYERRGNLTRVDSARTRADVQAQMKELFEEN